MMFDPSALLSNKIDPELDPLATAFEDELFELHKKLSTRLTQVADELVLSLSPSLLLFSPFREMST